VARILALATVYGETEVNEAATELLSRSIVGVDNLEIALKARNHPSEKELMPAPLNFQKAKLNRVVPTVDLRRYDALLFESTEQRKGEKPLSRTLNASIQTGDNQDGTDNHSGNDDDSDENA